MEWMLNYERTFKTDEGEDVCYIADAPHPLALDTDDLEKYHQLYNLIKQKYDGKFYIQPSNLERPTTVHVVREADVVPTIIVLNAPSGWAENFDLFVYDIIPKIRIVEMMLDYAREYRQFRPADKHAGNSLSFYCHGDSIQMVAHNRYLNTWYYESRQWTPVMDCDIPRFFRGVENKFIEWTAIVNCQAVSDILLMEAELEHDENTRV